MDPVTVLMGALSAIGAAVGETAIKDGYAALKALLVKKFGSSNPRLPERIDDYVQDPETYAKPAEKALRESGAAQDAEIVERVRQLLDQANAVKPVAPSLIAELNALGSNVQVVGGNFHGNANFGAPPQGR